MSRYNSYYPGSMPAAGRMQGMNRMRMNNGSMRADMSPGCPPACPQPPVSCCEPKPDCGCTGDSLPVAMAYVSWQNWQNTYDPETALRKGTVFPCLDLPFLAYKGARA